jgi:hypothetical protein
MPHCKITVRNLRMNQRTRREIAKLLMKAKEGSEDRVKVGVEIRRPPIYSNRIKGTSILAVVARSAIQDERLVPLVADYALTHHSVFIRLDRLMRRFEQSEHDDLSRYAEEAAKRIDRSLTKMRERIRELPEGRKKEEAIKLAKDVNGEAVALWNYKRLGFTDSVGNAREALDDARQTVEKAMLVFIEKFDPRLIVVHRYLREAELPGCTNVVL